MVTSATRVRRPGSANGRTPNATCKYLYCGVTTVLDPCDMEPDAFTRRDEVARGTLLGPRIYAAGPMFGPPGGHPVGAVRALLP